MTIPTLLADDLSPPQLSPGLPEAGALVVPASAAADLVHAALAYLGQIGRQPAAEQPWTVGDRRYLVGPLIVGDPAWGSATPAWLQAAVRSARLGLVLAGEHDQASEEEAVAYLMGASLAAPLPHDWAEIYFWLAARVLTRWGQVQEHDFWAMLGDTVPRRALRPDQLADLSRLLHDIRRSVERHARTPHINHTTHKGAHP